MLDEDEEDNKQIKLLAVKIMDLIQNEGLFYKPHVFLISLMLATGSSIATLIDSYDAKLRVTAKLTAILLRQSFAETDVHRDVPKSGEQEDN